MWARLTSTCEGGGHAKISGIMWVGRWPPTKPARRLLGPSVVWDVTVTAGGGLYDL